MTVTVAAVAVAAWLVLQIPIGIAIGCYIRRAQTPNPIQLHLEKHGKRGIQRRPFHDCPPPAVLLRG